MSGRESGRRISALSYSPPSDLADVVEQFWVGRWDLRGQAPHETELLGDPSVHLVFEAGQSRIVGVWTRLWRRVLSERGIVRGVKLHPGAARCLLPDAARRYSDRLVPATDVLGDVSALEQRVLGPTSDDVAFGELSAWLAENRRHDPGTGRAVALVRRARSDSELTRVDQLAAVSGMGVRALQRLFGEHVGASPKWVIRRFRLQEVAVRVEAGEAPCLTELALTLGYSDQAHLSRDFKAAVGRTIRQFERDLGA